MQAIVAGLQDELSTYIRKQTFNADLIPASFDQNGMTDTYSDLASSPNRSWRKEITSSCDKPDGDEGIQHQMDELKRLKSTAENMVLTFNSKLESLRQSRFDVHKKLLSTDLYLRLLNNSIFKGNDIDYEVHHLSVQKSHILQQRELSHEYICIAQADYEKVSQDLQCTLAKDKHMEKSFRAKIQKQSTEPLDLDCVDLLYQMFQRRDFTSTRKSSQKQKSSKRRGKERTYNGNSTVSSVLSRRSTMGRQSGRDSHERLSVSTTTTTTTTTTRRSHEENSFSLFGTMRQAMLEVEHAQGEETFISIHDPFLGVDDGQTLATDQYSVTDIVSPIYDDIPEGFHVEDRIFEVMLKLREDKILQERDVEELRKICCLAQGKLDVEEGEERIMSQKLDSLSIKEKLLKEEKIESTRCPYFVASVKQGIDEIKSDTGPAGYQDALFLPTEPVDAANGQIKDLGLQDIDLLHKIKSLRRKINRMEWNQELLELESNDAKEHLVDYHLLRLSSDLKDMLNGNVEDPSKTRKRIKNQLSRQEVTHQTKIDRLKKDRQQVKKTMGKRAKENELLERQVNLLIQTNEQERKGNETTTEPAEDKMLKIMRLSKRNHLIKRQSNEISMLRKELDRLKQKNFPSFSTVNSA